MPRRGGRGGGGRANVVVPQQGGSGCGRGVANDAAPRRGGHGHGVGVVGNGAPRQGTPQHGGGGANVAAQQNYSHQKNPERPEYWTSRGFQCRPPNYRDEVIARQDAGQFQHQAQVAASGRGRLQPAANEAIQQGLQAVCPGARLLKQGSRAKGTDIASSDFDYHISLPNHAKMTQSQRDELVHRYRQDPRLDSAKAGRAAVKLDSNGVGIDLMPQNATFHDGVVVEKPDPYFRNPGAANAVRQLKHAYPERKGCNIEKAVKEVGQNLGLHKKNDAAGNRRAAEVLDRIGQDDGLCS